MDEQLFYSLAELGHRWGVNPKTVQRIIKSGKLLASKIGGQYRIAREEVKRYEQPTKPDPTEGTS